MIMLTYCMYHTIIILQTHSRGKAKTMSVSTDARCRWKATQWQLLLWLRTWSRDLGQWEFGKPPSLILPAEHGTRPPQHQTAELTSASPFCYDAIYLWVWMTGEPESIRILHCQNDTPTVWMWGGFLDCSRNKSEIFHFYSYLPSEYISDLLVNNIKQISFDLNFSVSLLRELKEDSRRLQFRQSVFCIYNIYHTWSGVWNLENYLYWMFSLL